MEKHLKYIIAHVFLPPKLPQKDDDDNGKSAALIKALLASLRSLQSSMPTQNRAEWLPCIKMLGAMLELRDHSGGLVAENVQTAIRGMTDKGNNIPVSDKQQTLTMVDIYLDVLTFHIRAQNAGLIIRRSPEHYSLESFELSPTTEAIITTRGRLRRCFPGPAVVIDQDRIADASFLEPLCELLVNFDAETPLEVLPTVEKAKSKVTETRDTINPKFVTEMLTGILRAVGRPSDSLRIHKHTRDDVLWKDTLKPWQRSPLWLLLRVALQTSLMQSDDEEPHQRFKTSMIFFMTGILEDALSSSFSSDTLFTMRAKVVCRVLKLEPDDGAAWIQYAQTTVRAVQQELSHRWNSLQRHRDPLLTQRQWNPSKLSFIEDTELSILTLRPYLMKARARSATLSTNLDFAPDCGRRISRCSSTLPDLSLLLGHGHQIRLSLADLEFWVEHFLNDWLSANLERTDACMALAKVIRTYAEEAAAAYSHMPEDISLVLLTIMELWVALDKCALYHHPILHEYDPGFPHSLFEPLLLLRKAQMEQLFRIERYLATRRTSASPTYPSIFQSVDEPNSFAVRFFNQASSDHQQLRQGIEAKATAERSRKMSELERKSSEYQELMRQANRIGCEYVSLWRKRRQIPEHSSSCEKCRLKSEASRLTIAVHEWPLPAGNLSAMAAVFELDVPAIVSEWRDTTYSILVDMFSVDPSARGSLGGKSKKQGPYALRNYDGLKEFVRSPSRRLQLMSTTKSFVISHYRDKKISQATTSNICVNNGLNYSLYDAEKSRWTEELLGFCDVREKCTLKLPPGPYKNLQHAVNDTIHTSNYVIASQAECSEALTLHEFYAFGTFRSGHRLQWRNVARELTARILDFSRPEITTLVTQTICQAGPSDMGKACRESHVDLEEEEFGKSLLSTLDEALGTVEGNWQGATAARTLIAIAIRLLSLSPHSSVREGCFQFLRRARETSFLWTRELGEKLQEGQEERELKVLHARMLEMALTCYGTFDVDPRYLPLLLKSEDDTAVLTECAIIVHDRCPAVIHDLPASIKPLLRRHERLSSHFEPLLRRRVLKGCTGLDRAIRRLWSGYVRGSLWKALGTPSERWLETETSNASGLSRMLVHYNLLDGSLLVDGAPLTRLPRSYETHPTFRRLFGEVKLSITQCTTQRLIRDCM